MNTEHLKYFLAVADSLNITLTAKNFFLSQQALSSHIGNLEKKLEVKLFERTPALTLTYAGKRLYEKAKILLEAEVQLLKELREINGEERGRIVIGISHTRGRVFLPMVFPAFHQRYPHVEVVLKEGNSQLLEIYLQEGSVDLVIAANHFSKSDINTIPLLNERLFWVVPNEFLEEYYGSQRPSILDMDFFQVYPFVLMIQENRIRGILDKFFLRSGVKPHIILESDNIETMFALAKQGAGITIYPEMFLKGLPLMQQQADTVSFFPLTEEATISELVLAHKKNAYLSRFEKEFIRICEKQISN